LSPPSSSPGRRRFLTEKFGFKLTTAGLSGAVFIHLASALSVPVGGMLADALARRLAGGRILVQAFGLLAGADSSPSSG